MKATELVGKKAIRTTHITMAGGGVCRSFMEEPIEIVKATDTHIVYKWCDEGFLRICKGANDKPNILSYEYCDDNWIDYGEFIADVANQFVPVPDDMLQPEPEYCEDIPEEDIPEEMF